MSEPEKDRQQEHDDPSFLAEYWLWILVPLLLVLGVLAWLVYNGADDSSFIYGWQ